MVHGLRRGTLKDFRVQLSPQSSCGSGRAQSWAVAHPAVRRSGVNTEERCCSIDLIWSGQKTLTSLTEKRVWLFMQTCSSEQLLSLVTR